MKSVSDIDIYPANIARRAVAYVIDAVVAFVPAFVLLLFLSQDYKGYAYISPALYPAPIAGTITLIDIPKEVNETIGTTVAESSGAERYEFNYSLSGTFARLLSVVVILFYLLYSTLATYLFEGHTFGKYLMKIDVVATDTEKPGLKIVLRELVGKVLLNSTIIIPVISIFTILFTPKHLAIHDMIFKTRVVE